MDFKNLEYIVAISEELNISRAADKLFVSQPTLSQYLLKLEQDLGVPLFNRIKNALTLTYAGEIYVNKAKEILNMKVQTYNIIQDIMDLKKGRIIIGIAPDRGATILPSIFPKFHEKYPGISIDLVEDNAHNLETLTLQGHIDFSLIVLYNHQIELDYKILCNEEIVLVVPKSHKLAHLAQNTPSNQKPAADLSLFKDDPFVLMKQGTKIRQMANSIFKDAGINPYVMLESRSISTVQNTVSRGAALSIMPEKFINYENIGNNVICFSLTPQRYFWPVIVAYRKGTYLNRAMMDFISIIKSYLNFSIPPLNI